MSDPASLLDRMKAVSVEEMLLPLLIQLALIIAAARVFAALFRRIGQPAVVGEIAAGLLLGPSVLGRLWPGLFDAIFHPALGSLDAAASDLMLGRVLTVLAQLGLILLLFLIGLEFDFGHLRWHGKAALWVALAGMAVPFAMGTGLGWWMHPLVCPQSPRLPFILFLGTALSITAIPVLGRIMLELGITRTRVAVITLAAAALEDAAVWILLASVAALASSVTGEGAFDPWLAARMLTLTIGFVAALLLSRPLLVRFARWASASGEMGVDALAATLVLLFLCAVATNLIGVFALFGAFALGAVLGDQHAYRDAVNRRLGDVVTAFFMPVFFAYTGLRTRLDTLDDWQMWLWVGLLCLAAVVSKVGGCYLAARLGGLSRRESACIGVLMNARGMILLVVLSVGKDLGVIPDSVYSMLVLMALVTTFMTTPLLIRAAAGTELEACIRESGFTRVTTP